MKRYSVDIPIKGTISYDVEAQTEAEAKEKACEAYHDGVPWEDEAWETWESERLGFTIEVSEHE